MSDFPASSGAEPPAAVTQPADGVMWPGRRDLPRRLNGVPSLLLISAVLTVIQNGLTPELSTLACLWVGKSMLMLGILALLVMPALASPFTDSRVWWETLALTPLPPRYWATLHLSGPYTALRGGRWWLLLAWLLPVISFVAAGGDAFVAQFAVAVAIVTPSLVARTAPTPTDREHRQARTDALLLVLLHGAVAYAARTGAHWARTMQIAISPIVLTLVIAVAAAFVVDELKITLPVSLERVPIALARVSTLTGLAFTLARQRTSKADQATRIETA
jgi:hypothetical protein